jgi:hypothetical protein
MTTSKSKKMTLVKPKHTDRPTPWSPPSISQSQKKAAHRYQASAASTPVISRCTMVENVDDDEPPTVSHTLDADGDSIMELSNGKGRGTQGSCVRSEPSDDEDMPADDEEVELSMMCDPDIQN